MNTDIKRLKKIVKDVTGVDLDSNTRKREAVHARRIYYKILSLSHNMSLSDMGKTLKNNQNHATVLHQLKMFEQDFETDKIFNSNFRRITNLIDGVVEKSTEEVLKEKNLKLNKKVSELKKEIESLNDEIKVLRPKAIQPRNQQTKVYYCSEGVSHSVY